MSAPRTSPDTEPPSLPHDPAPLSRVLERVRAALANDLRTPEALDAMDDWAMANAGSVTGDPAAPRLFADIADALLGVAL